ncbi:MAG: PhzF family phenazine biosynthesis protein [Marinifilaceae bacterium]|jgi:PhzF family phenazine biosynthesis protein|nr:PhzF family phenazine biosynthesis protein [Marinifilaceae bacterium]
MNIFKRAAFSLNNKGGNPAGVVIMSEPLSDKSMLSIASDLGYAETAFLSHEDRNIWRIKYFSPEMEIDFCGHATIASGSVLGKEFGAGNYQLITNIKTVDINIENLDDDNFKVSFESPRTWTKEAPINVVSDILNNFNISQSELNSDYPVKYAYAGATHLILFLKDRETLRNMEYNFEKVKAIMLEEKLTTISLLWIDSNNIIHSRNSFASGGIYEDVATGAAAAALAGYLRDINWKFGNKFTIHQGEDMGSLSKIIVEYTNEIRSEIKISGETREIY